MDYFNKSGKKLKKSSGSKQKNNKTSIEQNMKYFNPFIRKNNRSQSPSIDIQHLPTIQKPQSQSQDRNMRQGSLEKNKQSSPEEFVGENVRFPISITRYKINENQAHSLQQKEFPNLKLMFQNTTDESHKKSLLQIMRKNPLLAASLNLYACSNEQIKKHKRFQRKQLLQEQDVNGQKMQLEPIKIKETEPTQVIQKKPLRRGKIQTSNTKIKQKPSPRLSGHQFKIQTTQTQTFKYNYYIGKGNNDQIVRLVMQNRFINWTEVKLTSSNHIHFKWQQNYQGYSYDKMLDDNIQKKELYNHFEFHKEITTKDSLLKNLRTYCNVNKMEVFNIIPPVFIVNLDDRHFKNDLDQFAQFYLNNMTDQFKNKFQGAKSIQFDHPKLGGEVYVSPNKINNEGVQMNQIDKNLESTYKLSDVFLSEENYLWLLKPADMNRGNGVHVFNQLRDLEYLLTKYYTGCFQTDIETYNGSYNEDFGQFQQTEEELNKNLNNSQSEAFIFQAEKNDEGIQQEFQTKRQELSEPLINSVPISDTQELKQVDKKGFFMKSHQFVIQKYIERPFLIDNRKFDLRIWVMLTHQFQYFQFKEGYLRTSCENYSLSDENPFIHLTNNAVQKNSKNYKKFEDGNQLSYNDYQKYLDQKKFPLDFRTQTLPKIKEIIKLSMISVKNKIDKKNRKFCFEIFGYDFMLDQNFKPWLIEVNTNPCLEESSRLLAEYMPRMLDDAFELTLDTVFHQRNRQVSKSLNVNEKEDKKYIRQTPSVYSVNNYSDEENMWEQLGQYYL